MNNITQLLTEKKLSWYWLSQVTGIPEGSLWDLRHKRKRDITLSAATKIAEALEVTLDDLIKENINQ